MTEIEGAECPECWDCSLHITIVHRGGMWGEEGECENCGYSYQDAGD